MTYNQLQENQRKQLILILIFLAITIALPNIITGIFLIISIMVWLKTTLWIIKLEDKQ